MKKSETFYEIIGVSSSATEEEIKIKYRSLAMKWHPDKNPGDTSAAEKMKLINEAYEVLSDEKKRKQYDNGVHETKIVIGNKRFSIELIRVVEKGDLSDVYLGKASSGKLVAVKIAKSVAVNDLLDREAVAMKKLRPVGSKDEKMFLYYTPFYQQMKIDDGVSKRNANIIGWNTGFYTLNKIRDHFPKGLPIEHAAWMFNRVLESLDHVTREHDLVHCSILPQHVMAYSGSEKKDIMVHGARIIDWCYSVNSGQKAVAIVPAFKGWYPPEILNKESVSHKTDLYMAGAVLVYMLGGDPEKRLIPKSVPTYMTEFIKRLMQAKKFNRPENAWEVRKELKDILETNFGPRKYVPFDIPSTV